MGSGDIGAIVAIKHAYFRHLDSKEFDRLGQLLSEGCVAAYPDAPGPLQGRAAIVEFLAGALGAGGIVTVHHGHHPEIELTGSGEARGTWYLQDRVIVAAHDLEISGAAFYHDRYRKVDGRWLIAATGYERLFVERRTHSSGALLAFTSRFSGEP